MVPYVFALFFKKRLQNSQPIVLFLLLGLASLTACETSVEIDVPAHAPKLAVQFNLSSEQSAQEIFIGRSQGVLASEDLWQTGAVKNAQITIKDAQGVTRQTFAFVPYDYDVDRGHYKAQGNFTPQPGQEYTLTVSAPGFETIQSTLKMPQLVSINSSSLQKSTQNGYFNYTGRLRLEFQDPQGQENYYRISGYALDQDGNRMSSIFPNEENGDIFGEEVERIEINKVFDDGWASDGLITYSDNVGFYGGNTAPAALEIILEHITQDLYLYERSRENYQEENPFAEPLNLHSNIRNGYGNFGGITTTTYRIQL